jgi:polyribonucleotide nucleotidyltransferase
LITSRKPTPPGKIPGGFFKREGRPSEKETLTSRLIDRPLRPLFPEGFYHEVQVVAMVMSLNPEIDPDIPAMIGASAALAISGIPFDGPIGAARVGYIDGQYVLNPSATQLKSSQLNLVVAGTQAAVLMVESEARELSEEVMLGAVVFGHQQMQAAIDAINELADEAGKPEWDWTPAARNEAVHGKLDQLVEAELQEAYRITSKQLRSQRIKEITAYAVEALTAGDDAPDASAVRKMVSDVEARIVRGRILAGEPRIDGRDTRTVRPIAIRSGVLPRAHGSALFTRGETQAIVVATLGTGVTSRSSTRCPASTANASCCTTTSHPTQPVNAAASARRSGVRSDMAGWPSAPSAGVLPSAEDFSYTIRVVSEITESNGSSSMASVCGASLALMDAGVPLKAHVAGIAMGLIKEGNRVAVLTDILGDEDHLGDMDFKVAGTESASPRCRWTSRSRGSPRRSCRSRWRRPAKPACTSCKQMQDSMSGHREEVSTYAPRLYTMKINPEKIRDVIGKGGAVIRAITEETGTTIDIKDDGTITIASVSGDAADAARRGSNRSPLMSKSARSMTARCSSCSTSAPSSASCPAAMACCTFRRLPTNASTPLPITSRKARKYASRSWKPTKRVACACR